MRSLVFLALLFASYANGEVNASKGQIRDLQNQIDALIAILDLRPPAVFDYDCNASSADDDQQAIQQLLDASVPGDVFLISGQCTRITLKVSQDNISIIGDVDGTTKLIGLGNPIDQYGNASEAVILADGKGIVLENLTLTAGGHGLRLLAPGTVLGKKIFANGNMDSGFLVTGVLACEDCKANLNPRRGVTNVSNGSIILCGNFEAKDNVEVGLGVFTGSKVEFGRATCRSSFGIDRASTIELSGNRVGLSIVSRGSINAGDETDFVINNNSGPGFYIAQNSSVLMSYSNLWVSSNGARSMVLENSTASIKVNGIELKDGVWVTDFGILSLDGPDVDKVDVWCGGEAIVKIKDGIGASRVCGD